MPPGFLQAKMIDGDKARVLPSDRIDCSQGARSSILQWQAADVQARFLKAPRNARFTLFSKPPGQASSTAHRLKCG